MGNRLWESRAVFAFVATLLFVEGCQRQPSAQVTPFRPTAISAPLNRETLFFIKGDGTLSPGAILKLKTWAATWGIKGKWTLGCPSGPGLSYDLLEKRLLAIRAELRKAGVSQVDTILLPNSPAGQYDAIYVEKAPF